MTHDKHRLRLDKMKSTMRTGAPPKSSTYTHLKVLKSNYLVKLLQSISNENETRPRGWARRPYARLERRHERRRALGGLGGAAARSLAALGHRSLESPIAAAPPPP